MTMGNRMSATVQKLLLIAAAGGLGAVARYGLAGLVQRWSDSFFPWGTATVNLVGCFLFAVVWVVTEERFAVSSETRIIILTGFMGAFTTFSTFMFETQQLLEESQYLAAVGNVALQNGVGLVAVLLGLMVGKWI
jgi:fluoride exporter